MPDVAMSLADKLMNLSNPFAGIDLSSLIE
jgi:hypothetical protein